MAFYLAAASARGFSLLPRTSRAEQKNFERYHGKYQKHFFFDLKPITQQINDFIDKKRVL